MSTPPTNNPISSITARTEMTTIQTRRLRRRAGSADGKPGPPIGEGGEGMAPEFMARGLYYAANRRSSPINGPLVIDQWPALLAAGSVDRNASNRRCAIAYDVPGYSTVGFSTRAYMARAASFSP